MPTYLFKNTETNEEFEEFMSISVRDTYLADNPHIIQLVFGFPSIGYNTNMRKPDDGFRDVLRSMKKSHRRSKIETF